MLLHRFESVNFESAPEVEKFLTIICFKDDFLSSLYFSELYHIFGPFEFEPGPEVDLRLEVFEVVLTICIKIDFFG